MCNGVLFLTILFITYSSLARIKKETMLQDVNKLKNIDRLKSIDRLNKLLIAFRGIFLVIFHLDTISIIFVN